jgi:putative ABC transport system substrate-binding protein
MDRRGSRLSRRQFEVGAGAAGLGLVAGCWLLPWQPKPGFRPAERVYRVGYLTTTSGNSAPVFNAFLEGLREYGWVDGRNIGIEFRATAAGEGRLRELTDELVRLPVDVIACSSGPAVRAARAATSGVPIVMVAAGDAVAAGDVASLARPGGNVTGVTQMLAQLSPKRLQLLMQAIPTVSRVAMLLDSTIPVTAAAWGEVQAAAPLLGVELLPLEVREPADLVDAFEAAGAGADAIFVTAYPLLLRNRATILDLAAKGRLPGIYIDRGWVERGGLMSYGPNVADLARRAAYYVDRILQGTKPADLPVEQPMTFDFVVNLKTAQALGITFPNEIMLQVTEVIP